MVSVAVGPGDDVEAWCTRCRMNLNHRVIAMVGREIKRVHCLTCGGDHKYYPPKYEGSPTTASRSVKAPSSAPSVRPREDPAVRAASEWRTVMKHMPAGSIPRPYRVSESYRNAEFIQHPVLGTGRVTDILGAQRIEVIFEDGRKILVCNRN
ncbi:MAG: hypothetical protein V1792_03895 [Pseudomonadota bacterium]